ncbi:hypothetical protein L596_026776 [Steinernema carpocapsae]|uniref:GOLD domain-containing protein n=1 Tax=Steinernema carpocapsae TaxID=34508 RepID=A0A4U5M2H8_STECR|nr:hypothetical protein L596_026776 [Steinernema carpocapsae]
MWQLLLSSLLLLLSSLPLQQALTINSHVGINDGGRIGSIINFDISSKSEMYCFYESIKNKAHLRVRVTAVNGPTNEMHLRITSPNEVFSEWFQGTGYVNYEGETQEEGDHELCITSRVNFGELRVNMELFAYVEEEVKQAVQDHVAGNALRDDMKKRVDQLFNNTFTSYYAMRYANLMIRRDEAAQDHNLYVIDLMSSLQTGIFLITSVVQVYMVRKMFKVNKSRINF